MQITKKEKVSLGIVMAILLVVLYYQFIYIKQIDSIEEKKVEKEELESEYNRAIEIINNIEVRESDFKILNSKIKDKYAEFYPTISQEHIILEIDKLLEESGVVGDIVFSESEISEIETVKTSDEEIENSTIGIIAEEYKSTEKNDGVSEKNNEVITIEEGASATTEQIKAVIKFNASYNQLLKLINLVDNYSRKIVIANLNTQIISKEMLSGTMTLEFYSIPKLNDEDEKSYLSWQINNVYGKDVPFSGSAAVGTNSDLEASEEQRHFTMMVRSVNSELPALVVGETNDEARASYIYSDKNSKENVKFDFNEENGVLTYKYSTSTTSYPKGESAQKFTVASHKIVIEINSESRVNSDDKSSVELNIVNNTSKTVEVIIKNDDTEKSRVKVISEGGTVNVTNK